MVNPVLRTEGRCGNRVCIIVICLQDSLLTLFKPPVVAPSSSRISAPQNPSSPCAASFFRRSHRRPVAFRRNPVTRGLSGSSQDQAEGSQPILVFVVSFSELFAHRRRRFVQLHCIPMTSALRSPKVVGNIVSRLAFSPEAVGSNLGLS